MLQKIFYSLKKRGLAGSLGLLCSYAAWYWRKAFSRDRRFLKQVNNYRMYLSLDDPGISTTLGRGGDRELDQGRIVEEEIKSGMTVLDIGANLGYYALKEALLVGPSGKVIAIEPVPSNYDLFIENVRLNQLEDRVMPFQMALSDHKGEQRLYLSKLSNLNTLHPTGVSYHQSMTGKAIDVKVSDIGSFLSDKPPVDFLRMDIEGAEVAVLRGIGAMCDAGMHVPRKILFETHKAKYDQVSNNMETPLRKLLESGYHVKRLISNSDNGKKWAGRGYAPLDLVYTDGMVRGIYAEVKTHDALDLICHQGGVRAAFLEYRGKS